MLPDKAGGISAYYASKGSRELRNEANKLRETTELAIHYTDALISILETAGVIGEVRRDDNGVPLKPIRVTMNVASLFASGGRTSVNAGEPEDNTTKTSPGPGPTP
jgi:hypothetical protein